MTHPERAPLTPASAGLRPTRIDGLALAKNAVPAAHIDISQNASWTSCSGLETHSASTGTPRNSSELAKGAEATGQPSRHRVTRSMEAPHFACRGLLATAIVKGWPTSYHPWGPWGPCSSPRRWGLDPDAYPSLDQVLGLGRER